VTNDERPNDRRANRKDFKIVVRKAWERGKEGKGGITSEPAKIEGVSITSSMVASIVERLR